MLMSYWQHPMRLFKLIVPLRLQAVASSAAFW
nr:unnamed protein product [Callosobruchus chinensis]